MKKYKVEIIESEAGWGQKIDEVLKFDSKEEAEEYVESYNKKYNNKKKVPVWYMYARYVG